MKLLSARASTSTVKCSVHDMGVIRSQIAKAAKWALARQGIVLVRPRFRFGFDVWSDIRRLADTWNYPIDVFFDVGANDGETAFIALRRFPQAQVICFEPNPPTFAKLTTKLGDEARFKGVNCAFGVEVGEVEMLQYDESSKINSLVPDAQFAVRFGKEGRRISVQCTTLDAYCAQNQIERIDVLKIDTEGFDFIVLQGSQALLRKQAIKFIHVEFNDLQPRVGAFGGALIPINSLFAPTWVPFYCLLPGLYCDGR